MEQEQQKMEQKIVLITSNDHCVIPTLKDGEGRTKNLEE